MRAELMDGTIISAADFAEQDQQEAQDNLRILAKGGSALFSMKEMERMERKVGFMEVNKIIRFLD